MVSAKELLKRLLKWKLERSLLSYEYGTSYEGEIEEEKDEQV